MAPRSIRPLPSPPSSLDAVDLPLVEHRSALVRVYSLAHAPGFWGRTGLNRFDAPQGEFGVLYAGADPLGAFIETCGDTFDRVVTRAFLAQRGWARIEPARPLRLADLTAHGLARMGVDQRLCSGEHAVAQAWSLAIWRHRAAVDGLLYRARHDPSRLAVALFDRAAPAVCVSTDGGLMDERHRELLGRILDKYQFAVL